MKKALSLLLSAVLVLSAASVAAFAADSFSLEKAYDSDGCYSEDVGGTLAVSIPDRVAPGSTFYIPLFEDPADNVGGVVYEDITNTDYFKFKLDKDTNSKLISSITVVTDKRLAGSARTSYLKVVLNDMTDTDEMKTDGTITFKAKADLSSYSGKSSKPASYVDDSTDLLGQQREGHKRRQPGRRRPRLHGPRRERHQHPDLGRRPRGPQI